MTERKVHRVRGEAVRRFPKEKSWRYLCCASCLSCSDRARPHWRFVLPAARLASRAVKFRFDARIPRQQARPPGPNLHEEVRESGEDSACGVRKAPDDRKAHTELRLCSGRWIEELPQGCNSSWDL